MSSSFRAQTFVAVGDRVYVIIEKRKPLVALDAATGLTLMTYKQIPLEVVFYDNRLIMICKDGVYSIDPGTGKTQWKKDIVNASGMVIGEGRVFLKSAKTLLSLDLKSGREMWRNSDENMKGKLVFYTSGILILSGVSKKLAYKVLECFFTVQ